MAKGGASTKRNTQHHCARAKIGGSNCRILKRNGYNVCEVHQWQCPEHPQQRPLLNQECPACHMRDVVIPEQMAAKALKEEIETTNSKIAKYNTKHNAKK